MRKRPPRERLIDIGLYAGFGIVTVFFLLPIYWVLSTSLKTIPQLFRSPPVLFPAEPQWSNYADVLERTPIGRYLLNSAIIVIFTVLAALLLAVPAAYALSRFRFKFRTAFLRSILAVQLISPVVIVVPLYALFSRLDLLNSYPALIAVYTGTQLPLVTWFLKGYIDSIPIDLDEAALVDGAGRLRALRSVVLPVAAPGITSAAILVSILSWSQFVIPFVLLDDRNLFPVSVGVVNLQSTTGDVTLHYLAAGSILAVAPVVVVFAVLQRYILRALTSGAIR